MACSEVRELFLLDFFSPPPVVFLAERLLLNAYQKLMGEITDHEKNNLSSKLSKLFVVFVIQTHIILLKNITKYKKELHQSD